MIHSSVHNLRASAWKRLVVVCFVSILATLPVFGQPSHEAAEQGRQRLADATSGYAKVSQSPATGMASFVRLPAAVSKSMTAGETIEAKAASFFAQHGGVFGIQDAARDLVHLGTSNKGILAQSSYAQVHKGVPVFAGILRTHFDAGGNLVAVNGDFVPDLALDVEPSWSADAAAKVAIREVGGGSKLMGLLSATEGKLFVFRTGLIQGVPGRDHLVWEVEVADKNLTVREFVYVDAHFGKVVDRITGIHHAIQREVSESSLGNVVWVEGDTFPTGNTDWDNEIDGAGETYNVIASMTNGAYLSYDGADATMRTVNNDPTISCPNANWNSVSTNYCTGVTGDDTVAHEWGHAYTEFTNNLIYQWQPGALNESYSDIWGEVVDLVNGRGTDSPGGVRSANGSNCSKYGAGPKRRDDTYRWLSGEDDPAFGGAIRDMWRPTCYGDPGSVTDGEYHCLTSDSGGVHINSGVPNHAFALMVDGGTYNGQAINGIGLTKAARIHWEAQNMLVPSSKFADHADALDAACSALIGATLYELDASSPTGTVAADVISAGDCTEVANASAAVEFRTNPSQCNFQTLLASNAPALCGGGTVTTVDLQDFEAGLGGWTASNVPVNPSTFSTPDWATVGSLPKGEAGSAAYVGDLLIGDCVTDLENGVLRLDSPVIALPAAPPSASIAFDHYVATEVGWDGGNVKISVNGGSYTLVPSSAYSFNAYNSSLNTVAAGNDNPMAGQAAFTGTDGGDVGGTWGQSQIDLSGIASAGDSIRIRFEMGLDGCNGVDGWYVDDVHVHTCGSAPPGCDNDGICESGEDCNNCSNDCAGVTGGKPSNRYCCGNGVQESAETVAICDGNF